MFMTTYQSGRVAISSRFIGQRMISAIISAALVSVAICGAASASGGRGALSPVRYDPRETFAPLTLPDPVNVYRSGDGSPGPAYWQNHADYTIHAQLNTATNELSAKEAINYTNNNPTPLACLWIHLDQNIYKRDARARFAGGGKSDKFTDGYVLDSVDIEQNGTTRTADYIVSDTRMQIRLKQAVPAKTGKITILIRYHYTVPGEFGGRTAHKMTRNGEIYDIAQWYPRMAVYDDLRGWDTLPYLGAEFYLDYGDFDYYVTVPRDMLVAGSGELQNPQQVLTATERARLKQARSSDTTVMVRGAAELDAKTSPQKDVATWHFRLANARDVSFSASRAFLWDAARIRLPDNKTALAMSFYPVESAGRDAWGRSTEYLKDSVENFSRRWFPYPYPEAVAVAGPVGGMEYPALVFDDMDEHGKSLFALTAHEIGHTWFPMIVGFNERRDQWMDEGFNTFIDIYESNDFQKGVFGPKRDGEYAPGGGNPADEIVKVLSDPLAPVMLTRADQVQEAYRHPITYFKSALGLVFLREQILGPDRFDWAFRKFISDWAFKHPSPSDFFRAMDSAGGEDLAWFWRGWYMNNWSLDLAAKALHYVGGDYHKGAVVTILNLDRLVMPATVEANLRDGRPLRVTIPAEAWIRNTSVDVNFDSAQPITSVVVDPDHLLPDRDRSNNVLRGQ
jgi:hypothetical protein